MKSIILKAAIIDDEEDGRNMIHLLLEQLFPSIKMVGMADSVATGAALVRQSLPDIIFLDVELTDGLGFDILASLPAHVNPQVIMITAHDHYALKALKASVLDFVLKPINKEEFKEAVAKAIDKKAMEGAAGIDFAALMEHFQNKLVIRKIKIPELHGFILADVDSIVHCEASGNYTILHFVGGKTKMVSRSLSEYEAELKDYGFARIHHKHLINIKQVSAYHKGKTGGGFVVMMDKTELEVSVRKRGSWMGILDAGNLSF